MMCWWIVVPQCLGCIMRPYGHTQHSLRQKGCDPKTPGHTSSEAALCAHMVTRRTGVTAAACAPARGATCVEFYTPQSTANRHIWHNWFMCGNVLECVNHGERRGRGGKYRVLGRLPWLVTAVFTQVCQSISIFFRVQSCARTFWYSKPWSCTRGRDT